MDADLHKLEELYKQQVSNISKLIPEGIIDVDLGLLQKMGLLNHKMTEEKCRSLTRHFQTIETSEKIILLNEQFIIWIVPDTIENMPITYTLIALNHEKDPHIEVAFSTKGIYNSSRFVLRILESFLLEIQETEEDLHRFTNCQ